MKKLAENKVFGGLHQQYGHYSDALCCDMRFAIFLPQKAVQGTPVPVVYWLSGLTCTDENFMQKAGAFRCAAELGIALIAPDTSPRGENVADAPDAAYDLGLGAGFYLNASQEPWKKHYQMYDYVVLELPKLIRTHFPINEQQAISGHSMGGHGAISIALKNPSLFSSVSAFSPISNPSACPWGQKAFKHYLGDTQQTWREYDSAILLANFQGETKPPILVDQGKSDPFLTEQLMPETLTKAAQDSGYPLTLRMQPGYDHSYFFISSFIADHLHFHAKYFTSPAN